MALILANARFDIPATVGRSADFNIQIRMPTFLKANAPASIVLAGFCVRYLNGDHMIRDLVVDVDNISSINDLVQGTVHVILRDNSGNVDDPFSGWVRLTALAEPR